MVQVELSELHTFWSVCYNNFMPEDKPGISKIASTEIRRQHRPQDVDMVNDISFASDGRVTPQETRLIHQWNDGFGNTVYTANTRSDISRGNIVTPDQIHALSDRIKTQQTAFGALDADQQSTITREFDSSKGTATSAQPYKDHLQNEALGKRFAELKANPPRPFGPK